MRDAGERIGCLRTTGVFMGVMNCMAGIWLASQMEVVFLLLLLPVIAFISYLLCTSDRFYVRHRGLIAVNGVITAIAGVVFPIAFLNYPPVERSLETKQFMAGLAYPLSILAGLWILAEAGVLFIRLWQTRKAPE